MRWAWEAQGRAPSELPWKSWTYPYAAWWGLIWCIVLIICEFYLSVWPIGEKPSAETFFANYVSVIVIILCYFGARIYYGGPWWVSLDSIDLDVSRRFYVDSDLEKAPKTGFKANASKVVGFIFN